MSKSQVHTPKEHAAFEKESASVSRAAILIVDDRPEKVLALEAALGDLELEIVPANSGREALRQLLHREFAVILLDINMPGMDGFETAALIRTRKSSEFTPIIFITALQDDMMIARGYKLGAVDYIAQPVLPEVLRTKVMVFVELYRKNQLLEYQARQQRLRADQQQRLAAASLEINSALSMEKMLRVITDAARNIIGTHQAITLFVVDPGVGGETPQAEAISSFSEKYAEWRDRHLQLDFCVRTLVANSRTATRLTNEQLHAHPDWKIVRDARIPPIDGVLAAPLSGREGNRLGVLYLSEKIDGPFNRNDEALLVQLAQMASIAIENGLAAEAREANRAKDHFLAVLSHELRTPLTPVLGVLQELQRDHRLPLEALEEIAMARRNIELEARLIDDLLDVTRISKGKVALNPSLMDVHELLREVVSICNFDITARHIDLSLDLGASLSHVHADLTRLQQVFLNILKNAIKFTPEGGRIRVSTRDGADGMLCVAVTDTGIGMEPEALPRIFDPFAQGKLEITRAFGGLGLGLSIAKTFVELHHGTLAAHSEGKDKGATFTVTLPAISEIQKSRAVAPKLRLAATPGERQLRILLVEDHQDTARIMTKMLTNLRHHVTVANTLAQALERAASESFDLLISDIGLPDGSGLDLMRRLRSMSPISGIALSGFGMEEDILRSRDAGFSAHFTKPLDIQNLLDFIENKLSTFAPSEQASRIG